MRGMNLFNQPEAGAKTVAFPVILAYFLLIWAVKDLIFKSRSANSGPGFLPAVTHLHPSFYSLKSLEAETPSICPCFLLDFTLHGDAGEA